MTRPQPAVAVGNFQYKTEKFPGEVLWGIGFFSSFLFESPDKPEGGQAQKSQETAQQQAAPAKGLGMAEDGPLYHIEHKAAAQGEGLMGI